MSGTHQQIKQSGISPKRRINPFIPLSGVLILFNIGLGYIAVSYYDNGCLGNPRFINPDFNCGNSFVISKKDYRELRDELRLFSVDKKINNEAKEISVYFRDLKSGPTMGLDERHDMIPASLLKLVYALAVMRLAEERGDDLLQIELVAPEEFEYSQTFTPDNPIKLGVPYTIDDLIFRSLAYSDNLAGFMLFNYLRHISNEEGTNLILEAYRDLGIINPDNPLSDSAVSAKGFSSILRNIYNASFLNPEKSEKILNILSRATFKDGLQAGIPAGMPIAHKFGERFLENGDKQLHDCGIIYYPENPYLLCIMTEGDDFTELKGIISEISEKVYEEVDSRRI